MGEGKNYLSMIHHLCTQILHFPLPYWTNPLPQPKKKNLGWKNLLSTNQSLSKTIKIPNLSIPNLSFSFVTSKFPPPPLHICTASLCIYNPYYTIQPNLATRRKTAAPEIGGRAKRERKKLKIKQGKKKDPAWIKFTSQVKYFFFMTAIAQIRSKRKQCKSRVSPSAETGRVLLSSLPDSVGRWLHITIPCSNTHTQLHSKRLATWIFFLPLPESPFLDKRLCGARVVRFFLSCFVVGRGGPGYVDTSLMRECMRKLDFVYVGGNWLAAVRGETKTRKEKMNK